MQIAKKKLLGIGGLALVTAMTAFACQLPAGAVSVGGSTEIVVEVYSINTETNITKPLDGDIFSNPVVDFSETHSRVKNVKYYLDKVDVNDKVVKTWELTEYEVIGEDESGHTDFSLNLDEYGGYSKYVFRSVATSPNNLTYTDSVSFTYAAISADQSSLVSNPAEVKFRVNYTSGVQSLTYQLLDASGNPVSKIYTTNTSNSAAGGYEDITIDMSGLDLPAGDYKVYIVGHSLIDGAGKNIGVAILSFNYAGSPNVPNTGSLLASLNIARADYLITGVVGFTAISIVALVVIKKAHRK